MRNDALHPGTSRAHASLISVHDMIESFCYPVVVKHDCAGLAAFVVALYTCRAT
jgi:hypothetical protein